MRLTIKKVCSQYENMKLENYLIKFSVKKNQFAAQIGVRKSSVSMYCSGKRLPEKKVMTAIFKATGGQVTPNDFYDIGDSDANAAADNEMKGTVENV